MRRFTIILCVLLIAGHLLTEAWAGVYWLYDGELKYIEPFWSPYYDFPEPIGQKQPGIDIYWYIKDLTVDFLWCLTFFVLAAVARKYSFRLFLIGCIWFAYHAFDMGMYLWNFKTSYWLYLIIYVSIILCIVSLFIPEKKKGIIKSLD